MGKHIVSEGSGHVARRIKLAEEIAITSIVAAAADRVPGASYALAALPDNLGEMTALFSELRIFPWVGINLV